MIPVSVFIPVLNEEDKIADALKSVAWADEIVVVDTGCRIEPSILHEHATAASST